MKLVAKILGILLLTLGVAHAQGASVSVELNKLEPREGACRAYLVFENATDIAFQTLKLDLVLFDADGVVAKRLAVEAAPLAAGKTSLSVFDMAGVDCGQAGRLLLNGVTACADAGGEREGCLDMLAPSARGEVSFIK